MATSKKIGIKSSAQDNFVGPNQPTGVTTVNVGTGRTYNNGAITVSWIAPVIGNTPTGYKVYDGATLKATIAYGTNTATITGLLSAINYTLSVSSYDSFAETSKVNGTLVTVTTSPATPAAPSATSPLAGVDRVTWTAPETGGSAITGYTWQSSDGKSGTTTGLTVDVPQEQGTAQTYTVFATNANGNSAASLASPSVTTTFSFAPFGAFGFFGAFGAFGFFGAFGAFAFSWSLNVNTEVLMSTLAGEPESTKPAGELQVGDKLLALDLGPEVEDWRYWELPSNIDLSNANVVETTITSITVVPESKFIYVDGDLFSETHWILTKKDDTVKFIKSVDIDTTYQRYSYNDNQFVDILLVESLDLNMSKVSINCEPYDNFFTKQMLVKDYDPNKRTPA